MILVTFLVTENGLTVANEEVDAVEESEGSKSCTREKDTKEETVIL